MTGERILIVEDERAVARGLEYGLTRAGFEVLMAENGQRALDLTRARDPHLILLDIRLPDISGFDVCKQLRAEGKRQPILMLTARDEELDKVLGFELGADDYVVKPYSLRELISRIRALLRRDKKQESEKALEIRIHNIAINVERFDVRVDGEPIALTATEFQILLYMAKHPGWVFTRSQIIDAVKGTDYPVTDRSVDVQIVGLRRKLKSAGQYIETIHGFGYRFKESSS